MKAALLIAFGGGIGSMARYGISRWLGSAYPNAFPWGTFAVNITGCLLIGIFWSIFERNPNNESGRLLLMTGLCGGYTTFSAFTLEGVSLLRQQRTGLFFLYVGASVLFGLAATYAGMRIIRIN